MENEVVQSSSKEGTQQNNSFDNLGKNILDNLTQAQTGENADTVVAQGVISDAAKSETTSDTTVVSQEGTEQTATQPQAETKPPAEDEGTVTRLEQQLADNKNLLQMLGIDPDGTTVEQLKAGLITPEQLKRQVYAPAPATDSSPQVSLDQKLTNIQTKVSTRQGDITAENYQQDMKEVLGVVNDLVETNKTLNQRNEQSDRRNAQQQNIATVYDELDQAEVFKNLDPSVQDTAKQLFLGAVDIGVSRLAMQANVGDQAYTPAGYKHVAKQFVPKFNELMTKAFEAGKAANTQQIIKNNTTVAPITAGTGSTTVQPPQQRFKIEDMAKNTAEYLAKEAAQV